jgi:hypothetical protein
MSGRMLAGRRTTEERRATTRLDAAKAVAPYVHPRLAVVDARVVAEVKTSELTEEQRVERARAAILEAFAERTPRVVEGARKIVAGKEIWTANEQENGEAAEEREG